MFTCEEGTVQGCVLASLGYCLAALPAMRRTRAAFPGLHLAAIIDDTNLLARDPALAFAAIQFFAAEMKKIGVSTVVSKTLVTASDSCDLSACPPTCATPTADGINFVGTPVAPDAAFDSFAASFVAKRFAAHVRQLGRLHLLADPQLAVRLLQTTFAGRARFLASIVPGAWAGRPLAGAALFSFSAALRAAADACHDCRLPDDAWCSLSEGGIGVSLIDCPEEHAYAFLCCHLRVLATLRDH